MTATAEGPAVPATGGPTSQGRLGGNVPGVAWPSRRRLQAFAFDPMSTRLGGRVLRLDVPFEPDLAPGPLGSLVQVVDYDATRGVWYQPVDLNDPAVLAAGGLTPSERDPRSHQQIVYAVACSVIERFERHLGRRFRWYWGKQLRLVPHAFQGRNSYFDPSRGAVLFGYFPADATDAGANLPGQVIFTALSVDVVAHEVTHAIVHRLRKYLAEPTNPDVLAWHEACADLVALFNHFAYPEIVADAVASSRGELADGSPLTELASQFGVATGRGRALREAVDPANPPDARAMLTAVEPHERGALFVAGVFDAYLVMFRSQIADLRRLATGGTGVLPAGALPPDLVSRVAREATTTADRLLRIVVRAFEFLPVVDVTFGDVLRAIVTGDRMLHPDDELRLRATLVEALRRRGIYPGSVASLAEDVLTWPEPVVPLSLTDGAEPVDLHDLIVEATARLDLGEPLAAATQDATAGQVLQRVGGPLWNWAHKHAHELALDPGTEIKVCGAHVSYLQASDSIPRPVVVVQFTQRRPELEDQDLPEDGRMPIRAGTTIIAHPSGRVARVVVKPLPLADPTTLDQLPEPIAGWARDNHIAGTHRLAALRGYVDRISAADPLTAWSPTDALQRTALARLHLTDHNDHRDDPGRP